MSINFESKSLEQLEQKSEKDLKCFQGKFPVPVGDICENLGVEVIFDDKMEDDLHGRINYDTVLEKYVIRINDNHSVYNNIFTIAHELGHYLKHGDVVRKEGFADRKAGLKERNFTPEQRKMEREANDFAANLLMPEEKFTEVCIEHGGKIDKLQEFFRVSKDAIKFRAMHLGLILE